MPFIPMLINFAVKKYLIKSILIVLVTLGVAVTAAIYLSGFAAFFSFTGILILGLLLVPLMIIVDLVKMFQVGGLFKMYFKKEISKDDLKMGVIQNVATFFMSEQLGSLFGSMNEFSDEKNTKNKDVTDVKEKNSLNTDGIATTGAVLTTATITTTMVENLESKNNSEEEDLSLEDMFSPEMMEQMQAMMQIMLSGNIADQDLESNQNKNSIEDVEVKNIDK